MSKLTKKVQCDICNKYLCNKYSLPNHKKACKKRLKSRTCEICCKKKPFVNRKGYIAHLKSEKHLLKVAEMNENTEDNEPIKEQYISAKMRNKIAGEQYYKCNNTPESELIGLKGYKCPLWKLEGVISGSFDSAGFDIDHIIERSRGGSNERDNLQALCPNCHAYKTRNFRSK